MAWTKYQKILALSMVITGSINTISTKWADVTEAVGKPEEKKHKFDHPFLQAVGMFLGEFLCLIAFNVQRIYRNRQGIEVDEGSQEFNRFIFLPAAMCDMLATSLMYVGLNLTFPSSFQMLRGAVIIFTALLSVAFLGRNIRRLMWIGMFAIIIGLVLVGVADIAFNKSANDNINGIIAGDLLIVMAQVIVAVQMVYEERFVTRLNIPPLQAVGWEGTFGFLVLGLLQIPFYYIIVDSFDNNPQHRLEDAVDGFLQMGNSWQICLATVGNIASIAFFNFCGISVTKEMSATTRMVLDSVRTIVIKNADENTPLIHDSSDVNL
ncbi:hypothetical protein ScPMuIL_008582 [Solemya velum]